jgi:dUTP pyrophosphatase
MNFKVKLITPSAKAPTKNHPSDAGWDLYCSEATIIASSEIRLVRTGVIMAIPNGYVGLLRGRSGLAIQGIDPQDFGTNVETYLGTNVGENGNFKLLGGVIDSAYRGEVMVIIKNLGATMKVVNLGDKIAQIIIIKIDEGDITVMREGEELDETDRGEKGFGSSDLLIERLEDPLINHFKDTLKYLAKNK